MTRKAIAAPDGHVILRKDTASRKFTKISIFKQEADRTGIGDDNMALPVGKTDSVDEDTYSDYCLQKTRICMRSPSQSEKASPILNYDRITTKLTRIQNACRMAHGKQHLSVQSCVPSGTACRSLQEFQFEA